MQALSSASDCTPCPPFKSISNAAATEDQNNTSHPSGCSKPTINAPDAVNLIATHPPIFDTEILDFPAFIRKNYKGQVDNVILDALKLHSARCLQHLHKFNRDLTAAITKENASLAAKYIEHYKKRKGSATSTPSLSEPVTRRQTNSDILSAPDSGTEVDF